jgi:hypothetical protein
VAVAAGVPQGSSCAGCTFQGSQKFRITCTRGCWGPAAAPLKASQQFEFSTDLAEVQAACNQMLASAGVPQKKQHFPHKVPRWRTKACRDFLQLDWEDGSVALGVFVGPNCPMLAQAVGNTVPWGNKGLQIELGSASKCVSGSTGARSTRGY